MSVLPAEPGDLQGFAAFTDLLTAYRLTGVLMEAHEAGLFAAVGGVGRSGTELCTQVGWDPAYGERFLRCLCGLGLLRLQEDRYALSDFAAAYLDPASPCYQGRTLAFERRLRRSWQELGPTLAGGRRVVGTEDKDPDTLCRAFGIYLGAMDEAARIRASELWEALPPPRQTGTLLDLGAGSGAFAAVFLDRYPGWRAILCDLPEVTADTDLHPLPQEVMARINWCACNLLSAGPSPFDAIADRSCHLVLLSNVVHCQGQEETALLLAKAVSKTADGGLLLIHDFFTDTGWRGALYDLHMMINTYNGRTYSRSELIVMAGDCGLELRQDLALSSGSDLLVFTRCRPRESRRAMGPSGAGAS